MASNSGLFSVQGNATQMISGVIAKFAQSGANLEAAVQEIAAHPLLDVGDLVDGVLLPITIDASCRKETEATTQWLQSRGAIEFVDVVFVHFENECNVGPNIPAHHSGTTLDDEN